MFAIYGTTYGAGNGSTTFNLPDFRNRTIWGADSFGYVEAGLPNINGEFISTHDGATGAFKSTKISNSDIRGASGSYSRFTHNLDASRSNAIYGKSNTVQPPAVKVRVVTRYK